MYESGLSVRVDCSSSRAVNIIIMICVLSASFVIILIFCNSLARHYKEYPKHHKALAVKKIRADSVISGPIPLKHNPYSYHNKATVSHVCNKHSTNAASFLGTPYTAVLSAAGNTQNTSRCPYTTYIGLYAFDLNTVEERPSTGNRASFQSFYKLRWTDHRTPTFRNVRLAIGRLATHVILVQIDKLRDDVKHRVLVVLLASLLQPVFPQKVEKTRIHGLGLAEEEHVVQHWRQHIHDRLQVHAILIAETDGRGDVVDGEQAHLAADLHSTHFIVGTSCRNDD